MQIGQARDLNQCLVVLAFRVDLADTGRKQQVTTRCHQLLLIGSQSARVAVEIFVGTELQRVDEDTGHHGIGLPACCFHQFDVALMQIAHGGHQRNFLAGQSCRFQGCAQIRNGVDGFHITRTRVPVRGRYRP